MALTKVNSTLVDGAINTTSAGNVGIGTANPVSNSGYGGLTLNGTSGSLFSLMTNGTETGRIASLGNETSVQCQASTGYINFVQGVSGGTERMRIDSSGNLLVGTTTIPDVSAAKVSVANGYSGDSNSTVITSQRTALMLRGAGGASNDSGAYSCLVLSINQGLANNPGVMLRGYGGNGGGVYSLQINGNGNITNSNNSYGSLSDFKLKENIVDATPKLEDVMRLQVRNFNFKNSLGYEDNKQIGFIAQEFENVFPGLVESVSKDDSGEDEANNIKSIKTSVLVPILVKAIQEQQAIITDLKARIETLEAK